jgi:hypothetical protein
MTGLHAIAHMLLSDGRIVAIQDDKGNRLGYDDLVELAVNLMTCPDIYRKEGWFLETHGEWKRL